jgi:hypothetical protein
VLISRAGEPTLRHHPRALLKRRAQCVGNERGSLGALGGRWPKRRNSGSFVCMFQLISPDPTICICCHALYFIAPA